MSDLINRLQKAKTLANDLSLPKWQRPKRALEAFSGVDLSEFCDDVREQFESDLAGVNQVLARCSLKEGDDFRSISEVDLQQILDLVDRAASNAIEAELDRIVRELDAGVKKLPVEAILETREHRDLMIPKLIEMLRDDTAAARRGDLPEGNAHFFAIFLLTEFQAEEAFPVILEAFSLPGELPFDLFGDAVTSNLAQILAQFAGNRPEVMDAMIRNPELNEYVRWEAAQAYVHLVRDKRMTRDDAVERLRQHLCWAVAERDMAITGRLISVLTSFAPREAMADIEEAYRLDLVETFLIDLETVKDSSVEGDERVRKALARCSETGIKDTIEELKLWAAFTEKPVPRPTPPPPLVSRPDFAAILKPNERAETGLSKDGPRVGRNAPCPCGSGKKFKKCCGSRMQPD